MAGNSEAILPAVRRQRREEAFGLVDGSHFAAPACSSLKCHADNPLHFRNAVLFCIPGVFHAIDQFRFAAFAKINAAGQFAQD